MLGEAHPDINAFCFGSWGLGMTSSHAMPTPAVPSLNRPLQEHVFTGNYIKANPWNSLFRILVNATTPQMLALYFESDQPRIKIRLRVLDGEGQEITSSAQCLARAELLHVDMTSAAFSTAAKGDTAMCKQTAIIEVLAEHFDPQQLLATSDKVGGAVLCSWAPPLSSLAVRD